MTLTAWAKYATIISGVWVQIGRPAVKILHALLGRATVTIIGIVKVYCYVAGITVQQDHTAWTAAQMRVKQNLKYVIYNLFSGEETHFTVLPYIVSIFQTINSSKMGISPVIQSDQPQSVSQLHIN